MRTNHLNDAVAELGESDPATHLIHASYAALAGRLDFGTLYEFASDVTLARAATEAGCALLAEFLTVDRKEMGKAGYLVAMAIERFASNIDDLGRYQDAIRLYEAIMPIVERYGEPVRVAEIGSGRAIVLRHLGRHADAVEGF